MGLPLVAGARMVSQSQATTVGCLRYGIITQYVGVRQGNRLSLGENGRGAGSATSKTPPFVLSEVEAHAASHSLGNTHFDKLSANGLEG